MNQSTRQQQVNLMQDSYKVLCYINGSKYRHISLTLRKAKMHHHRNASPSLKDNINQLNSVHIITIHRHNTKT